MKNRVKALRTKMGLTQTELAKRAGTSQQQIQRLETGQVAARLDLAASVAEALNSTVAVVFPGSTPALGKFKEDAEADPRYLPSEDTFSDLAKVGIEGDCRFWIFRVRLRGQKESIDFSVEPEEKRRLFRLIQNEPNHDHSLSFVVFDSESERVGINLAHLSYCHFIFERSETGSNSNDGSDNEEAHVYLAHEAESLRFDVDTDRGDPGDEDDHGAFRNIFFSMETRVENDQRFYFEDGDGEDVFVRAADLTLLRVPLWVVDPGALKAAEPDDDTEEVTAGEVG